MNFLTKGVLKVQCRCYPCPSFSVPWAGMTCIIWVLSSSQITNGVSRVKHDHFMSVHSELIRLKFFELVLKARPFLYKIFFVCFKAM